MYTLWHHCRIATMAAGHYQLLDDGAMLTDGAVLLWVGNRAELPDLPVAQRVDLQGRVVTPGLVDCHSHAVFGGDRAREFEQSTPRDRPAKASCWRARGSVSGSCAGTA